MEGRRSPGSASAPPKNPPGKQNARQGETDYFHYRAGAADYLGDPGMEFITRGQFRSGILIWNSRKNNSIENPDGQARQAKEDSQSGAQPAPFFRIHNECS